MWLTEVLSNHTNYFSILPDISHVKEGETQVCFIQEILG